MFLNHAIAGAMLGTCYSFAWLNPPLYTVVSGSALGSHITDASQLYMILQESSTGGGQNWTNFSSYLVGHKLPVSHTFGSPDLLTFTVGYSYRIVMFDNITGTFGVPSSVIVKPS